MPPPPIQGVGNDAGFTMQVELRDGSFDMAKLQSITNAIVENARSQSAIQLVLASFRADVPQLAVEVDRVKTQTFARELRAQGRPILEAAVEAARSRFRPILMTSFAFILGVLPLVLADGAGASARKSIGITVFTDMIASTCLAVLFVPPFFVIVQRFEEWLTARKGPQPERVQAE